MAYEDNTFYGVFTGFCVKSNGIIMSCAHRINQEHLPDLVFTAKRLEGDELVYSAKIVLQKPNWDITIFQIDGIDDTKVVKFGSGVVSEGDTVVLIGNPLGLVGSFLVGHCVFKCVSEVSLPTDDGCFSLYDSTALTKTPPYRVMGHYRNRSLIERTRKKDTPLPNMPIVLKDGNIHPLVPVIQTKGLGADPGASGAPLFNGQGELIGMHICSILGYEIGVHVSLLKECLGIASRDDPREKSQPWKVLGEHDSIAGNIFEMGIASNKRQKN